MSIIFSDIDGTIYGKHKKIHPELQPIIKEAKDASIMFNIATGNGLFPYIKSLGKSLGAKYLITSNGASIYDVVEDKIIYEDLMPAEEANKLLSKALEIEVPANWWNKDKLFTTTYTPESTIKITNNVMSSMGPDVIKTNTVTEPIYKIEFYDTKETIDKLFELFKGTNFSIARMTPEHIEVTKLNVSKATAIRIICDLHQVDEKTVMTIGDSANDQTMLELTDFSYAMANSDAEDKGWAKLHTATYSQNGLGMAIIDYMHRVK